MFLLGDKVYLAHNVALGTMTQGYVYVIDKNLVISVGSGITVHSGVRSMCRLRSVRRRDP